MGAVSNLEWPWRWDSRPHGWHLDEGGNERYGPLPETVRHSPGHNGKLAQARPEVQAARALGMQAYMAEKRRRSFAGGD